MRLISTVVRRKGEIVEHHRYAAPVAAVADRGPGLGDLAATFAQPVAIIIDTITERMLSPEHKTALAKCPACGRRHNKLNLLCPDILTCPFLGKLLELLPEFARKSILEASAKHARISSTNHTN